jgi:flagellar biosynthesis/type III secretory pathway protein FliH
MSISYSKILAEAGPTPEHPQKTFAFRAYKDGVCQEFSNRPDADRFSKLVEKYQTNVEYYNSAMTEYNVFHKQVLNKWSNQVREYFDELSDAQYAVLYAKAYDDGHSAGYDEVFSYMEEYATFYSDMLQARDSEFEVRPGSVRQ